MSKYEKREYRTLRSRVWDYAISLLIILGVLLTIFITLAAYNWLFIPVNHCG